MRRASTSIAAALVAVAALAAVAVPAQASLGIDPAGSADFPERAYTLHVPNVAELGPGEVSVTENGVAVDEVTVESAAVGGGEAFGSVLVIDASNSMAGRPIVEAMRSARAFADRRAAGQRLALVTFNGSVDVPLPLTSDEEQIQAALATRPELAPSTHLHDALDAAVTMLTNAGVEAGSVVVLSDGADNGSTATLEGVTERAQAAGVKVFAVGLRSSEFDPRTLRELAVGGSFAQAANVDELEPIFEHFGAQLASDHLISYHSSVAPGTPVTVEVRVDGIAGAARDHYETPADAPVLAKESPVRGGFWASPAAMVAAIALAAALLGLAVFGLLRPHSESPRERLARFLSVAARPGLGRSGDGHAGSQNEERGPLTSLGRNLGSREWWGRFEEALEIAAIDASPIRIVAMAGVGTAAAFLLFTSVFNAPLLSPLALGVPLGTRAWIRRALRRQRREFADQLADNLQLVASSLRAGQSMVGALAVVVEEASEPARTEFRRIVNDERLGVPLEDAIRDVGRRMDNRDLEQVALVATIQRETGGNTAEVLDQVIATIRERAKLRRLMETLTAHGRLSQIVISSLPLVLLVVIAILNRDYLDPLFGTGTGRIVFAFGAGLAIAGSLIIKRIVEVRV